MKSVYWYYHSLIFLPQVAQENNYNYSPIIGEELSQNRTSIAYIVYAIQLSTVLNKCQKWPKPQGVIK